MPGSVGLKNAATSATKMRLDNGHVQERLGLRKRMAHFPRQYGTRQGRGLMYSPDIRKTYDTVIGNIYWTLIEFSYGIRRGG